MLLVMTSTIPRTDAPRPAIDMGSMMHVLTKQDLRARIEGTSNSRLLSRSNSKLAFKVCHRRSI